MRAASASPEVDDCAGEDCDQVDELKAKIITANTAIIVVHDVLVGSDFILVNHFEILRVILCKFAVPFFQHLKKGTMKRHQNPRNNSKNKYH